MCAQTWSLQCEVVSGMVKDALSMREERKGRASYPEEEGHPGGVHACRENCGRGHSVERGMCVMPGGEMVWCLHGNREL